VSGREIVGPGFSDGSVTCMRKSDDGGQMGRRKTSATSKTTASATVPAQFNSDATLTSTKIEG
jgi:hypothetical protein